MKQVNFVLLPNKKPLGRIPDEQTRFWRAQWLGRLKSIPSGRLLAEKSFVPFDQPEVPYTMLYLAGILRDNCNCTISFIDLWEPGLSVFDDQILGNAFANLRSNVFLFSSFTNNYSFAKQCVKYIKSHIPGSICIIGGPHATFCAEECISDGFDHVVCGFGEEIIIRLAGMNWSYPEKILINHTLSSTSYKWERVLPAYDLLPEKYLRTYYARLFTTHGCPFQCVFCSNTIWRRSNPIFMSFQRVSEEMDLIRKNIDFKEVYINDENFTLRKAHYEPIAKLLAERQISWGCETRIDQIDNEKLDFLSNTGCLEIDYGLENTSREVLKKVKKSLEPELAYRVFYETSSRGIRVHANLMVGLPGETMESAIKNIDQVCEWIKEGVINTVDYFIAVPYPGTELFNNPGKFGLSIKTNDWDKYREDDIPVFDSSFMTANQIYECWKQGLKMFSETIEAKILTNE